MYCIYGIQGNDDSSRLIRRTLLRYVSLGYVLTMTAISPSVKKRFPTLSHLTEAGTISLSLYLYRARRSPLIIPVDASV